jgi:hypothetical protein
MQCYLVADYELLYSRVLPYIHLRSCQVSILIQIGYRMALANAYMSGGVDEREGEAISSA